MPVYPPHRGRLRLLLFLLLYMLIHTTPLLDSTEPNFTHLHTPSPALPASIHTRVPRIGH